MTIARADRNELLRLARASIETGLRDARLAPPPLAPPALSMPRATFVTLSKGADLRGCCGSIEPSLPLAADVWRNAWAAAFADPRFPALDASEYPSVDVHVSVLSPLTRSVVADERALLQSLRPGRDGVVLQLDAARATFLPEVWEMLPNPADFLTQLKLKAGWPATFWSPDIQVWRYETESFGED